MFYFKMTKRTNIRSNSGQLCRNSRYSWSVQNPITCSTPARLYQLRSNRTISPSPADGQHIAGNTTASFHVRSVCPEQQLCKYAD